MTGHKEKKAYISANSEVWNSQYFNELSFFVVIWITMSLTGYHSIWAILLLYSFLGFLLDGLFIPNSSTIFSTLPLLTFFAFPIVMLSLK